MATTPSINENNPSNGDGNDLDIKIIGDAIYFYSSIKSKSHLELLEALNNIEPKLETIDKVFLDQGISGYKAPVTIILNSPGGYITDSLSIYDTIRTWKRPVNIQINGIAASGATIISCGAAKVTMQKNAYFMIHELSGSMWGYYSEFVDHMVQLDTMIQKMIGIYSGKTGKAFDEIKELFSRKTVWMTADQALEYGFIDEIID